MIATLQRIICGENPDRIANLREPAGARPHLRELPQVRRPRRNAMILPHRRGAATMVVDRARPAACGEQTPSEANTVPKPTFTDVNGVKFVCRITEDAETPHLVVSELSDDGAMEPVMVLNSYDATYLGRACETYLKQSLAERFTAGTLSALTEEQMRGTFGAAREGDR